MITEQRITRYVAGLKELQIHLYDNRGIITGKDRDAILKKHKLSKDILTRLIELNYIKRIGVGKYKFILTNIEPIHARKVIIATNSVVIKSIKTKKLNLKVTKEKDNSILIENKSRIPYIKAKKNIKTTSITNPVKEKRRVSILWGLISWSKN